MIDGFDNALFAEQIEGLTGKSGKAILEKSVIARAGIPSRIIFDFKKNNITDVRTFCRHLRSILDAVNSFPATTHWYMSDFYRPPVEKIAFHFLTFPGDDPIRWRAWGIAYDEIFSYQEDRDADIYFQRWAENSARADMGDLEDWEYRNVQGGAYLDDLCFAVFHATIKPRAALGLITYAGVCNAPGFDTGLFFHLKRDAIGCCQKVGGERMDILFEIDRPDPQTWKLVEDRNVGALIALHQTENTRARFRGDVLCLKRACGLIKKDEHICMLRDNRGAFFDYVQPDMRLEGAGAGRPMWLAAKLHSLRSKRKPSEAIAFMYKDIYDALYRPLIDPENVYWGKLNTLRASRMKMASNGRFEEGSEFEDAKRLFMSDPILSKVWSDINLRSH